ncbi:MAG: alpha/beta hydrolase [Thermomicrobiales bacterium]
MSSRPNPLATRRRLLAGAAGLAAATAVAPLIRSAAAQDATPEATPVTFDTSVIGGAKVDPQMKAVLDALVSFGAPPLQTVDPQIGRNLTSFATALQKVAADQGKPAQEAVADIDQILIPGPAGQILGRVYKPMDAPSGLLPVIVYFHGGGFVIANLDVYDASPRALANAAKAIVVSIAYRLAPENPFPAAVDDAYAATQYLIANAGAVGGDPTKVAVAGESAGGNLATVVCLRAKTAGGKQPVHQLLVYPVATFAPEGESAKSVEKFADAIPLNSPALQWFGKYYLADPTLATNPEGSPLLATDLSGLPPATVIGAEIDPLQSQGKVYADALEKAGVKTDYHLYKGVTHEFFGMGTVVDKAKEAVDKAAEGLTKSF